MLYRLPISCSALRLPGCFLVLWAFHLASGCTVGRTVLAPLDASDVTPADTPDVTDATAKDTVDATPADAPDVTAMDAPDVTAMDAPDVTAMDAPDVTAMDAPDVTAMDAPDVTDVQPACPTGQTSCGGACIDLQTNPMHCGGCNMACPMPANATATCAGGMCGLGACNAGFGNCDMNAANGCETNTGTSVTHCGRCGMACPAPANATATCTAGACGFTCNAGFTRCGDACVDTQTSATHCGRCDNACPMGQSCRAGVCNPDCNAPNQLCGGMCIDPRSDTRHCGGCNRPCPAPANATATCAMSACGLTCNAGFGNCDMNAANGCETNTGTSVMHCGRCNMACPAPANATATCTAGACGFTCNTGFTRCGDACVDTQTSATHCGRCDNACPMGQSCRAGACTPDCNAPNQLCGGMCIDPRSDTRHCGGCNRPCPAPANATATCAMSACGLTCNAGFGNCDANAANGCETNTNTTVAHCGRCGMACPAPANGAATCAGGACGLGACNAGFGNCDMNAANGCEVNTAINASHCGGCNMACPAGATCVAGACVCPLGTTRCGTACVNIASDTNHCGMCNRACPTGQVCRTGTCQASCASGSTLCGTQCVTLGDDINHCGACNNRCPAENTCSSGVCVPVTTVDPIGCSDGTREAFTDRARYPNIAACAGAWALPGIFPAIPASTLAACATLGNSSTMAPANGAGCSASNLCARGWRICNGGDVVPRAGSAACVGTTFPAGTFFAAAVSGTGCGICALRSGTVTGSACTASSCATNCRESGDLNNDFFGCGTIGSGTVGACDGLSLFSGNDCGSLGAPWVCGGGTQESRTVIKTASNGGGVLCCRD